jgi:hypothetical protein
MKSVAEGVAEYARTVILSERRHPGRSLYERYENYAERHGNSTREAKLCQNIFRVITGNNYQRRHLE